MNPKKQLRQLRDDKRWQGASTTVPRSRSNLRHAGLHLPAGFIRTAVAVVLAAAVITGLWVGLADARSTPATTSQPTRSATPSPNPTRTTPLEPLLTPTPPSTRTYTATPRTGGCPGTAATVPHGAVTSRIADVDGDGRPDTEWTAFISSGSIDWGIQTASGAVIGANTNFASGGERSASIGTLASGQAIALVSDGHFVELFVLHNCKWVNPKNSAFGTGYGEPATDTGAGCINGQLFALSQIPTSDRKETTFSGQRVQISNDAKTVSRTVSRVFGRILTNFTPESVFLRFEGNTCSPSKRITPKPHS